MVAPVTEKQVGKILIADDSSRMRRAIRATVEDLVGQSFEAADGQAAIEAYFLHKPDWLTMDIEMHPMNGLTASREIKLRDPRARILILTVHDTKAFRDAAKLMGADGYLLKDDLAKIREAIVPGCDPFAPHRDPMDNPANDPPREGSDT